MAYLLDANVFMSAKNLHYGSDFCPAFWDWLIRENRAGSVLSIEKVGNEIAAGEDELSEWAAAREDGFFRPPDEVVFARKGDLLLLDARTLEGLNLRVDAKRKKLVAGGPLTAA